MIFAAKHSIERNAIGSGCPGGGGSIETLLKTVGGEGILIKRDNRRAKGLSVGHALDFGVVGQRNRLIALPGNQAESVGRIRLVFFIFLLELTPPKGADVNFILQRCFFRKVLLRAEDFRPKAA